MKVYKGQTGKAYYYYNFREIENLSRFNPYRVDVTIDVDPCPFCGFRAILNRGISGWYAECFNCGSRGPECGGDWIKAAKIWNGRSLREYCEASGRDKHELVTPPFDIEYRLNEEGKEFLEEK